MVGCLRYSYYSNGSLGGITGWRYGGGASAVDADVFGGGGKKNYSIDGWIILYSSNPMIEAAKNLQEFNALSPDEKAAVIASVPNDAILTGNYTIEYKSLSSITISNSLGENYSFPIPSNGSITFYSHVDGNLEDFNATINVDGYYKVHILDAQGNGSSAVEFSNQVNVDFAGDVGGGLTTVFGAAAHYSDLVKAAKNIGTIGTAISAGAYLNAISTGQAKPAHHLDAAITGTLLSLSVFPLTAPFAITAGFIYGGTRLIGGEAFDNWFNSQFKR